MRARVPGKAVWVATAISLLTATACTTSESTGGGEGTDGVLRIGSPRALAFATDPAIVGNAASAMLNAEIYDQLVQMDGEEYKPELATAWTTEGNDWTFTIRDGVTFSDGSPLTAKDVKASLDRTRQPALGGAFAGLLKDIESVEAPDDRTLVITTGQPLGTMLANMSQLNVAPAAQLAGINDELQQQLGTAKVPVGSGPYKLESHTSDQKAVLAANDKYWGQKPKIGRLEYTFIPELSARYTALDTGAIDVTWGVPPDQLTSLEGNDSVVVERVPSYQIYLAWFNGSRKPFDDVRVRQAMIYAIDTDQMIKDLFPGYGKRATAPIPSTVFGYGENQPYAYDPERAKRLLAEAGLANGFSVSIQYVANYAPQIDQVVATMISYWAKIGVKVKATPKEAAAWGADLRKVNFDINTQDNPTVTGDADYTLGRLYGNNAPDADVPYNGIRDPELDRVLSQARRTLDQGEREKLYQQACKIMWDKALGYWPLEAPMVYAWRKGVEGITLSPTDTPLFQNATKSAG